MADNNRPTYSEVVALARDVVIWGKHVEAARRRTEDLQRDLKQLATIFHPSDFDLHVQTHLQLVEAEEHHRQACYRFNCARESLTNALKGSVDDGVCIYFEHEGEPHQITLARRNGDVVAHASATFPDLVTV